MSLGIVSTRRAKPCCSAVSCRARGGFLPMPTPVVLSYAGWGHQRPALCQAHLFIKPAPVYPDWPAFQQHFTYLNHYISFIWGLNFSVVPWGPYLLDGTISAIPPTETTRSCQCSTNLEQNNPTEFIVSEEVSPCFEFLLSLIPELWLFCPHSCLSAVVRAITWILMLLERTLNILLKNKDIFRVSAI